MRSLCAVTVYTHKGTYVPLRAVTSVTYVYAIQLSASTCPNHVPMLHQEALARGLWFWPGHSSNTSSQPLSIYQTRQQCPVTQCPDDDKPGWLNSMMNYANAANANNANAANAGRVQMGTT
jgi:hypothetical protein